MASPDVSAYVGLDLIDLDAQTLVTQALATAAVKFPGWVPREGNTEVLILEELAALTEEQVYALNRVPDGVVEATLRLMGLTRAMGSPSSASVTFTKTTLSDVVTVPAGTTVRIPSLPEGLDLATTAPLTIPAGTLTGTVTAATSVRSTAANGIAAATTVEVLDALTGVASAALSTPTAGGTNPEDGDAFLARAAPRLSTLTTTLARRADVEAYVAATYPTVKRVKVLDLYNPTAGGTPGSNPGYTTVAVLGAGGTALDAPTLATIRADVESRVSAGLTVSAINATVTPVNVTITVLAYPGQSAATVQANVIAALSAYLNPDAWAWGSVVRRNELIARADTAAGVDVVLSVTTPAADLTLTGAATLASAGTITVTVQAG